VCVPRLDSNTYVVCTSFTPTKYKSHVFYTDKIHVFYTDKIHVFYTDKIHVFYTDKIQINISYIPKSLKR